MPESVSLKALAAAARARAEEAADAALAAMRALIPLVVRANPGKSLAWALARKDVSEVVATARRSLLADGAWAIRTAYAAGQVAGKAQAAKELTAQGISPELHPVADSDYLVGLLERWRTSASSIFAALPGQLGAAVADVHERPTLTEDPVDGVPNVPLALGMDRQAAVAELLDRVSRSLSWRAGIGASTATVRGDAEALQDAVPDAEQTSGVRWLKTWRVDGSPGYVPCLDCRRLDGVSVPLAAHFPTTSPVFGGVLSGPPAHPNCRCRIEVAREDLAQVAAEQTSSPVATSITASQIRNMTRASYRSVLAVLIRLARRIAQGRRRG